MSAQVISGEKAEDEDFYCDPHVSTCSRSDIEAKGRFHWVAKAGQMITIFDV